jgi:hypothetical protein
VRRYLIKANVSSARFLSLLYFAQSIFLVFAAVYIAKEALEEVLLGSGERGKGLVSAPSDHVAYLSSPSSDPSA